MKDDPTIGTEADRVLRDVLAAAGALAEVTAPTDHAQKRVTVFIHRKVAFVHSRRPEGGWKQRATLTAADWPRAFGSSVGAFVGHALGRTDPDAQAIIRTLQDSDIGDFIALVEPDLGTARALFTAANKVVELGVLGTFGEAVH